MKKLISLLLLLPSLLLAQPSGGVTQIRAGDGITISPTAGRGVVTINATGSGSGNVTNSGTLTSTAIATGAGTTVVQTPSATSTLDSSGNVDFAGTITSGSSNTAVTDSAGKILSAALNTVAIAQGGTGATTASAAVDALGGAAATGTGGLVRRDSPVFTTGISTPMIAVTGGGGVSGRMYVTEGTAVAAPADSVGFQAPTNVTTPFYMTLPVAPVTGLMLSTGATDPTTISFVPTGTGVTTFLTTPSGANLAAALTSDIPGTSIADTAVTPGSYTNTSLTVDQQGRITAASSGSAGGSNNAALFTSTASAAADNTTTETSIIGTGVGSKTTSANYFGAGTVLLIRVSGYLSTPAVPDNLTIRIKAGSTAVGSAVFTLPLNLTNQVFVIEALVTCRTAGASGTFIMNDIVLSTNSTLTATISAAALNTATVTLDTTGTLAWDVTADWGAAQSGETITGTNALLFSPGNGAVIDPGANGFMDRTALNTTAARTLTGTANQIGVTNGGGGGNPVFSLVSSAVLPGSPTVATAGTAAGSVATIDGAQTLTNKSIAASQLAAGTLTASVTLGENFGFIYDPALSADGKYSGTVRAGTAGATLAFGDVVYLAAADSRWELTDSDASGTSGPVLIGICVLAAAADGDPTTILMQGFIRADAAFPAMTISAPMYLSGTAGDITGTAPTSAGTFVRTVGHAWTADELFFSPSPIYFEN